MFSRVAVGARTTLTAAASKRCGGNNKWHAAAATNATATNLRYFSFKSALVTGGSVGIGAAICRRLAKDGFDVVVVDTNKEQGEVVAKDVGGIFIECDVSKAEEIQSAIATTAETYGGLSALVNNAGIVPVTPTPVGDFDNDEWKAILDVNLNGLFYGMKYGINQMIKEENGGGCIVNLASIAGFRGFMGFGPYVSSKFAVRGLTQVAAVEYARANIRVNAIAPTGTDTPMLTHVINSTPDPNATQIFFESLNAVDGMASPDDIAGACSFLCNEDDARYITGHTLPVDGGALSRHANAPNA